MPSQFHLRDLINHVVIGAVVLLLLLSLLYLLLPDGWSKLASAWNAVQAEVNVAFLLPLLLVITYVAGAVLPGSRSFQFFNAPTTILTRALRITRIIAAPEPPATEPIKHLFVEKATKLFQTEDTGLSFDDLFQLAQSLVLTSGPSMEQLDIERHFILMHFNAKLCIVFSISTIAAVCGILRPATHGRLTFLAVSILCYAIARASGRKAQANQRHWQTLIIRCFVVSGLTIKS